VRVYVCVCMPVCMCLRVSVSFAAGMCSHYDSQLVSGERERECVCVCVCVCLCVCVYACVYVPVRGCILQRGCVQPLRFSTPFKSMCMRKREYVCVCAYV